ncbi:hypothetical protein ABBQ32_005732 [Trebouxia sp. C0010 RCD-2024]
MLERVCDNNATVVRHVYSFSGLCAGRQLSDNAPDLPWTCTKQQLETARSHCDIFHDSSLFDPFTCIPSEFYGKHFEKGLGLPGALKSSEHLLLAGPVGKSLLQGCMHPEQQAVVYDYLDLLGAFWEKTFTEQRLQQLETEVPVIMDRLAAVLPAWELDINRHMMVHLVESIRRHGPPWAWSMFGFERLWGRLTKWMTQTSHPEATMVNSWKAFVTSCNAMPDRAAELHRLSDENTNGGSASLPFHFIPTTFNRTTYQLQLPAFVYNTGSTPISLTDHRGRKRFGYGRHKDRFQWQAELHLFYCKFPALCKPCDCAQTATCSCLSYGDLWDKFTCQQLQEGRSAPTKEQLSAWLYQWDAWAQQQPYLSDHEKDLCYGPDLAVDQFDRALFGEVKFAATTVEGAKFARDSLVLTKSKGRYWAGRVTAFLCHDPPGWQDCEVEHQATMADVHWFAHAAAARDVTNGMATHLQCPVFKREFMDDPTGNLWPLDRLSPCKLLSVPCHPDSPNLVVLSRFASFLDQVPEVQ